MEKRRVRVSVARGGSVPDWDIPAGTPVIFSNVDAVRPQDPSQFPALQDVARVDGPPHTSHMDEFDSA